MKKKYILLEFIIVFFILVLPPILRVFSQKTPNPQNISFSLQSVIFQLSTAIILYILSYNRNYRISKTESSHFSKIVLFLCWLPITFGLLMVSYAIIQAIYMLIPHTDAYQRFSSPLTLSIVIQIIVAAFYEETLYRMYIPNTLLFLAEDITRSAKGKSIISLPLFIEVITIILFSLPHRYMGWVGVLNAFVAGIILRVCAIKTYGIKTGTMSHLSYNLVLLMFIAILDR